jgi:hypothetical protein
MLSQMPGVQEIAVSAGKFTTLANGERDILSAWKGLKVAVLSPVEEAGWPNVNRTRSTSGITHLHLAEGITTQHTQLRDLPCLTNVAMSLSSLTNVLQQNAGDHPTLRNIAVLGLVSNPSDFSSMSDERVYYEGEERFPMHSRLEVPSLGGMGKIWTH